MKRHQKWIWAAAALLWIAFIFSNSLRSGTASAAQSGEVVGLLESVLRPIFGEGATVAEVLVRKAGHLLEYLALGGLLCVSCAVWRLPCYGLWAWLGGTLVAAADETLQLFVEGRSGQVSDVMLDTAGVLLGCLLVSGFLRGQRRRSRSMESLEEKE